MKLKRGFDVSEDYVRMNIMGRARLQDALEQLTAAIQTLKPKSPR